MTRRILGIDLSTHAGWATVVRTDKVGTPTTVDLTAWGRIDLVRTKGVYPWGYVADAERQADNLVLLVAEQHPDEIVIEETNGGGRAGRFTQKLLEFLHFALLQRLGEVFPLISTGYLSTSTWRRVVGAKLTKDDRKSNDALRKAKRTGDLRAAKAQLGVRGKTTTKHVAVRWANQSFDLRLRSGDHDVADAIALAVARARGAAFESPPPPKKRT